MDKVKVSDNLDRKVLNEGRNHQMGFAFLKKVLKNFETVQPISPCKDYLNDVVWCEHLKSEMTAYGFKYAYKGIFNRTKFAYIAIKILPYMSGDKYNDFDTHEKNLKDNINNLLRFINHFDGIFGLQKTEVLDADNGMFVLKFDKGWARYTYTISLFSLLVRLGQFYKDGDPMLFIKNFKDFSQDVYLVQATYAKIDKLVKLKSFPEFDLNSLNAGTSVHNFGIKALNI